MKKQFSVGLLISTYNWPKALNLVLQSVMAQTILPDEVIIADDGSESSTRDMIDSFRDRIGVPIKHFWHKDDGFRKTAIINQALAHTQCKYIIQIDGDMVLNPHFIEDHIALSEPGYYIRGSRVLLSPGLSTRLVEDGFIGKLTFYGRGVSNRINAFRSRILANLFFIKKAKRSDNFHGSNCAYWREDFVRVNGYNNQMCGWGHEDIELAARFVNAGVLQKKIKMMAICFHLYHHYYDREREETNYNIYLNSVKSGALTCADGYKEINVLSGQSR